MGKEIVEKALLYKCSKCGKIYACWWKGIHNCDGCLQYGDYHNRLSLPGIDCPKILPSSMKEYSSGLCPNCSFR